VNEASSPDVTAPAKPARREHIPLGIAYMIAATILFAVSSAVSKWLVGTYPVGEVLFTRTAVALITCALFIVPRTGFAVFRTQRLSHHVMRSVSQAFSQTFLLIAFSLMSLAGAIAINFSSPLFATLVSALLLKEAVGPARWAALLVGFCGVLIVTNPGADAFQIGALFALANADALSADAAHGILHAAAAAGMDQPDPGRRGVDRVQRRLQRGRAILVDARAAPCAGVCGGAVLLSLADLGEHPGLCGLGRDPDRVTDHRLGRRGGVRPVPDLARKQRPPSQACRRRLTMRTRRTIRAVTRPRSWP